MRGQNIRHTAVSLRPYQSPSTHLTRHLCLYRHVSESFATTAVAVSCIHETVAAGGSVGNMRWNYQTIAPAGRGQENERERERESREESRKERAALDSVCGKLQSLGSAVSFCLGERDVPAVFNSCAWRENSPPKHIHTSHMRRPAIGAFLAHSS